MQVISGMKADLKDIRKHKFHYLMTLPALLYFLVFSYFPMFGVILAFKDYKFNEGILGSKWIGFQNFEFFFTSDYAFRTTFNTLFLNGLFISLGVLFQVGIALLLNEVAQKLTKRIFQSLIFLPYFISWVVVSNFVYAIFGGQMGMLNGILGDLGLSTIEWYGNPSYWPAILSAVSVWKWTGYGVIIYLAVISSIDTEIYEASSIDGANRFQKIIHITLPHLKSTVIILTLLAIGRIFYGDFGMIYSIVGDNGLLFKTTDVIDTYVFRGLRQTGDIGMASAAGLYQSFMSFVVVILANWVTKRQDKDSALF